MCAKSKREKREESLRKARQWHDNRKNKSGTAPLCGSNNAAVGSRIVGNLSPSSPIPGRHNGGFTSPGVAAARTPPARKMSKSEKQKARERARQWHADRPQNQNKRNSNHNWEENCSEDSDEEVIDLTTTPPNETTERNLHRQHHNQPNQGAPYAAVAARPSFAAGRMAESPPQQRGHRAVSSFAAGGRGNSEHEEETGWACPLCTLINPQRQSTCGACYHDITARNNNSGQGSGMQPHEVDSDGDFVLEPERVFGFATGASASGATHGPRYGVGPSGVAAFDTTSFGGGTNHSRISANDANRNNAFLLSQLLLTMGSRRSNAFWNLDSSGEDVDNMSYERLLQVFGDGSENRGASAESIASLPVSTIGDPVIELPEDKRQCSICLEDFRRGDERTSLPCLHGFHSSCANTWLSSNGSCPMCKTSVNGSR